MSYDVVIKNGRIVTAAHQFAGEIGIAGEKIAALATRGLSGRQEIDASGLYVLPGAIDGHVHLQDATVPPPTAHTFREGTEAAACGGVTTVIDFAMPAPGERLADSFDLRLEDARGRAVVDYGLHLTLRDPNPSRLKELASIVDRGCASLKLYMANEGFYLQEDALYRAMQAIGALGGLAILHAEIWPVTVERSRQLGERNEVPPRQFATRLPAVMEGAAIHVGIAMAQLTKTPLLIFHVSCREGVRELRMAKDRGEGVFGEALVTQLVLTDAAYDREEYPLRNAPPLRSQVHQDALWHGLRRRDLDIVSSDHFPMASSTDPYHLGSTGLEPRLALVHTFGVLSGKLDLEQWVEVCCTQPARLFALEGKGDLAPGYDADIVLFDPQRRVTLSADTLHVPNAVTMFDGITVTGYPVATLSRGELIAEDGKFVGRPGRGEFVATGSSPRG